MWLLLELSELSLLELLLSPCKGNHHTDNLQGSFPEIKLIQYKEASGGIKPRMGNRIGVFWTGPHIGLHIHHRCYRHRCIFPALNHYRQYRCSSNRLFLYPKNNLTRSFRPNHLTANLTYLALTNLIVTVDASIRAVNLAWACWISILKISSSDWIEIMPTEIGILPLKQSVCSLMHWLKQLVSLFGHSVIHWSRTASHLSVHIWLRSTTLNSLRLSVVFGTVSIMGCTYGHSSNAWLSGWHVTKVSRGKNITKFILWNISLWKNSKYQSHLWNSHSPISSNARPFAKISFLYNLESPGSW